MSKPPLTPLAQSLPASVPFVGPETQERAAGRSFVARLGANENVFGPSPNAIAAMRAAADQVWMYADPESHDLRDDLARHHGISPQNIMIGEGIDALLGYLVRLFIGPADAVVTSAGAYPTFNYHVAGYGGNLHAAPYVADHEDPGALIDLAQKTNARLIYIANPDNPMGTWHSGNILSSMINALPSNCLLVLDEAYIDFAPDGTAPEIDASCENVIRMRTFSKAYGMAGARVGYAIGAVDNIAAFNKIRNHFGMNRIAVAGARAALADQNYLADVLDRVAKSKARIANIAAANGLIPIASAANFVTLDGGRDGKFAIAILDALVHCGIFVRMPFVAPQNRCIRVSAGTESQLDAFEQALPAAIADAKRSIP